MSATAPPPSPISQAASGRWLCGFDDCHHGSWEKAQQHRDRALGYGLCDALAQLNATVHLWSLETIQKSAERIQRETEAERQAAAERMAEAMRETEAEREAYAISYALACERVANEEKARQERLDEVERKRRFWYSLNVDPSVGAITDHFCLHVDVSTLPSPSYKRHRPRAFGALNSFGL